MPSYWGNFGLDIYAFDTKGGDEISCVGKPKAYLDVVDAVDGRPLQAPLTFSAIAIGKINKFLLTARKLANAIDPCRNQVSATNTEYTISCFWLCHRKTGEAQGRRSAHVPTGLQNSPS